MHLYGRLYGGYILLALGCTTKVIGINRLNKNAEKTAGRRFSFIRVSPRLFDGTAAALQLCYDELTKMSYSNEIESSKIRADSRLD